MLEQNTVQTNHLFTVKQFAKEKGFMSESGLRYLIFHSTENRLDEFKVIKRIGKKILIDFNAFELWLEEINSKVGANVK